jgi:hypothetical protein
MRIRPIAIAFLLVAQPLTAQEPELPSDCSDIPTFLATLRRAQEATAAYSVPGYAALISRSESLAKQAMRSLGPVLAEADREARRLAARVALDREDFDERYALEFDARIKRHLEKSGVDLELAEARIEGSGDTRMAWLELGPKDSWPELRNRKLSARERRHLGAIVTFDFSKSGPSVSPRTHNKWVRPGGLDILRQRLAWLRAKCSAIAEAAGPLVSPERAE